MVSTISQVDSGSYSPPPPPPPPPVEPARYHAGQQGYRLETSYHPQLQPPGPSPAGGPQPSQSGGAYGIPPGQTLADVAGGTRAQPFDVTLSQLATAVYGTRGAPPEGWTAVTDQQLRDAGVEDVQAWRLMVLGANDTVERNALEFRAEIYTDGNGNYVLSYRGTAEGGEDWANNFHQGAGFQTPDGAKFTGTAVTTAIEFARVFGNGSGGNSTNLAITGHSQGGGLATMGSLASGVPAVTFDASGIHPNTLEHIGIVPQQARDIAEGGQIRAYSLESDALTNLQDSWVTGLVAPDALGTQIVVKPASADAHNMFNNYGPIELEGMSPEQLAVLNAGVETARHTPFVPINPVAGVATGGANLAGNLAYAAISHSPNALTAGMVEHQPWQEGYRNPTSLGRELQNLLPDVAKDDYARNTHDLISDIGAVNANEFAQGRYLQGAARIVGDVGEGVFNSVGDTVDGYADTLAATIDDRVDGWAGDVLSGAVDYGGDAVEFVADAGGQAVESLADGAGWLAQGAGDLSRNVSGFIGGLFDR